MLLWQFGMFAVDAGIAGAVCAGTRYSIWTSEQGLRTGSKRVRQKGLVTASGFSLPKAEQDRTVRVSVKGFRCLQTCIAVVWQSTML